MSHWARLTVGTAIIRVLCIVSGLIHVLAGFEFRLLVFRRRIDYAPIGHWLS